MRISRQIRTAAVAIAVLIVSRAGARADIIMPTSGNTNAGGTASATFDFAVYNQNNGTVNDPYNTGINFAANNIFFSPGTTSQATLDTGAKYLYLYEIVNNNPSPPNPALNSVTIPVNASIVTSYGFLQAFDPANSTIVPVIFQDRQGTVGPGAQVTNNFGTDGGTFAPAALPNTGVLLNPPSTAIAIDTSGDPHSYLFSSTNVALNPVANTLTAGFDAPGLVPAGYTTLLAFTSNFGPAFVLDTAAGAGETLASGFAPTAVPEPQSIVLALIGLPALALAIRHQKRLKTRAVA